jgi:Tfp pilus assembly protein PilF
VIGHSAITDFARPTLRRPLIIKFHHDFLLAPKSDPNDVGIMEQGYSQALAEIFRLYTPIVIGYGGNDGSLMGLLEKLPERSIPGGILWCWRTGDPAGKRIEGVVAKQAGTLIEISGFDELMTLLEKPFGHAFNPDKLSERAEVRARELKEAHERLSKKAEVALSPSANSIASSERSSPAPVTATASAESSALLDALSASAVASKPAKSKKKAPPPWWHWQNRINATTDLDEKEKLFNQGLEATSNAVPLLGNYAIFLKNQRKDDVRAEEYFLKALTAEPNRASTLGNYASFLESRRKNNAQAEEYYLKALAAEPTNASILGNYASFLQVHRKDDARAEEYYLKALAAEPNHANNLCNYANLLQTQRNDYARAEEYYLKALAAEPNNATILGNYANLLQTQRKDGGRAEEYYLKALAAEPNNATVLSNYAIFLKNQRKDDARAEEHYLKALAVEPNHINNLGNYMQLLIGREKFSVAAQLANRVWPLVLGQTNMGIGEIVFSRWLLSAVSGRDGRAALGRLKTLLQAGYYRAPWNFDAMLAACIPKLTEEQGKLANKLAAAILDEAKVAELETEPSWQLVQAIPLNEPWPDEPVS